MYFTKSLLFLLILLVFSDQSKHYLSQTDTGQALTPSYMDCVVTEPTYTFSNVGSSSSCFSRCASSSNRFAGLQKNGTQMYCSCFDCYGANGLSVSCTVNSDLYTVGTFQYSTAVYSINSGLPLEQFAYKFIDGTYISTLAYSGNVLLGGPDVYPYYGESSLAWTPQPSTAVPYVEFSTASAVTVSHIDIYITAGNNSVSKVMARHSSTDTWVTVYSNSSVEILSAAKILSITTEMNDTSQQFRIEGTANQLMGIDAVRIYSSDYTNQLCYTPTSTYAMSQYASMATASSEYFDASNMIGPPKYFPNYCSISSNVWQPLSTDYHITAMITISSPMIVTQVQVMETCALDLIYAIAVRDNSTSSTWTPVWNRTSSTPKSTQLTNIFIANLQQLSTQANQILLYIGNSGNYSSPYQISAVKALGYENHSSSSSANDNGATTNSKTTVYAIIGTVVGAAVVIAIVVAIILWRRRSNEQRNVEEPPYSNNTAVSMEPVANKGPTYQVQYLQNITILERLGSGNFGEVYKGTWKGSVVALKKVSEGQVKEFEREANLLCGLQHPNVVRMLGLFVDNESNKYMVMELVSKGSLKGILETTELSTKEKFEMMTSACRGMVYLEHMNVIHRDLAARNLLVTHVDGEYSIKIADFGLSRETNEYKSEGSLIPIRWSAPEVLRKEPATSKSDVFSFAVVMHEILSGGATPYEFLSTNRQVADYVTSGKRIPKNEKCSDKLYKLMMDCWEDSPDKRPTFMEILERLEEMSGMSVSKMKTVNNHKNTPNNYNISPVNNYN